MASHHFVFYICSSKRYLLEEILGKLNLVGFKGEIYEILKKFRVSWITFCKKLKFRAKFEKIFVKF